MRLVFLGPPGAGKGTLADLTKEAFSLIHISTGDIFRANIKNQTLLGKMVQEISERGGLVPDAMTIEIVKERLAQKDCQKGYLLDGFPRTTVQAQALEQFSPSDVVINFVLGDEEVLKRLTGRRVCQNCSASFHVSKVPPKVEGICDKCGGTLYQRKDDQEATIVQRLRIYQKETEPLLNFYQDKGLLKCVDAYPSPVAILEALTTIVKPLIIKT